MKITSRQFKTVFVGAAALLSATLTSCVFFEDLFPNTDEELVLPEPEMVPEAIDDDLLYLESLDEMIVACENQYREQGCVPAAAEFCTQAMERAAAPPLPPCTDTPPAGEPPSEDGGLPSADTVQPGQDEAEAAAQAAAAEAAAETAAEEAASQPAQAEPVPQPPPDPEPVAEPPPQDPGGGSGGCTEEIIGYAEDGTPIINPDTIC